jgi:hypothetical protein
VPGPHSWGWLTQSVPMGNCFEKEEAAAEAAAETAADTGSPTKTTVSPGSVTKDLGAKSVGSFPHKTKSVDAEAEASEELSDE